jgi:hypothetical protein
MPDPETAAVLRAVLDEVCASVSPFDACTRINVASRLLEVAKQGKPSIDDLREAGRVILPKTPTMWR